MYTLSESLKSKGLLLKNLSHRKGGWAARARMKSSTQRSGESILRSDLVTGAIQKYHNEEIHEIKVVDIGFRKP